MKKTYLKPETLTVKVVPQQMIAASDLTKQEGYAKKDSKVYGRQSSFSGWSEEE